MVSILEERSVWLATHIMPHEPALRAWLSRRRLVGLDVDDIIQETYTRLITAENVDHVINARAYAFRTAASVLLLHFRKMKIVSIVNVADFNSLDLMSDEPSPELEVIQRSELRRLAKAIAELPIKVRQVFTLRRVHGLSQREVAEKLGIAESTVEKHTSKGLLLIMRHFLHGGKVHQDASNSQLATSGTGTANGKKDVQRNRPRGR